MKKRKILSTMVMSFSAFAINPSVYPQNISNAEFSQVSSSLSRSTLEPNLLAEGSHTFSSDYILPTPLEDISTAQYPYYKECSLIPDDYVRWAETYHDFMADVDESEEELVEQIEKDLKRPDYPEFIKYLLTHSSDAFKSLFINTWLVDGAPIFNQAYFTALKVCQNAESKNLVRVATNIQKMYAEHYEGMK